MSIFRVFHLRQLRRQPLRTVLAAIALGAAVATAVVALVVVQSIDRSIVALQRDLAGPAPLRIEGPLTRGGIAPSTVADAASVDGVAAAVPVVQGVVFAENPDGFRKSVLVIGADCRAEALFGTFGCERELADTSSDRPVLMSAALARDLGPEGYLRTDVGRVRVGGVTTNDRLDRLNGGSLVIYELTVAQRILDRGDNVDTVYVKPEGGVGIDRLQARLSGSVGEHNFVLTPTDPSSWFKSKGPLLALLGLVVLVGMGLSSLLVYNIVALSLAERRRDLAIVSAVGAPPGRLTRNVLAESAVLGLIGGVLGIAIGTLIARPVVRSIASVITEQASGLRVDVYLPPVVFIVSMVIGVGTAVVASIIPARRASRIDLAAELHGRGSTQEAAPRRSLVRVGVLAAGVLASLGLSFLAQANGSLERWQPPVGAVALIGAAFLSFALAGSVAPMLLSLVLGRMRTRGGAVRLSLANLVSQPRRTSVIAAAVASAVGMGVVLGSLLPAIEGAVSNFDGASTSGRVWVSTLPLNNSSNIDSRLSYEALDELRAIDGVASIDETRCSEVSDRVGTFAFCGLGGLRDDAPKLLGDDVPAVLARGEAVVATGTARLYGVRPGDVMRVPTPSGIRDVRVGAIWVYARDNGHSVVVSVPKHEELMGRTTPHTAFVVPEPGTGVATLEERIREARIDPDMLVLTGDELAAEMAAEIGLQVEPFWIMQRMLLFVALVGTLSTLLLIGVQRRRELGILGAVGFRPASLGRMTLLEAIVAAAAGGVLGAIASTASFETLRNSAAASVGARPPFNYSLTSALSSIALGLVVAAIGAALPAWRTSRLQIVEAIRDE